MTPMMMPIYLSNSGGSGAEGFGAGVYPGPFRLPSDAKKCILIA